MDRVEEIEAAIDGLPQEEYRRIVQWFRVREQGRWDATAEVKSVATRRFWDLFHALSPEIQKLAVKKYEL